MPHRMLIAAPAPVVRELGAAFEADGAEILGAETWEDAMACLHDCEPDVVILCYVFDEARPYRLLQYLGHEWRRRHVPTILVRALPVPLGRSQEEEIRAAYKSLGVDEFFNLYDEGERHGRPAALRAFRDCVLDRLRLRAEAGMGP